MKIAALILIHRYAEQAVKLIEVLLADEDITVFIHVDKKSRQVFEIISNRFADNPRVRFATVRYKVYWGSYNQIRAIVQLLCDAGSHGNFDYTTLLSGQDLPVKPLTEFKEFLKENRGKEFMQCFKLPSLRWGDDGGLERMQLFWTNVSNQRYSWIDRIIHEIQRISKYRRRVPSELYGGTCWFNLSSEAVSYIADHLRSNAAYLEQYKHTRCADEIIFQSLIMNSPLRDNVVDDDLRYVEWERVGAAHPRTLCEEDYAKMIAAENRFFARKFDMEVDVIVIKKVLDFVGEANRPWSPASISSTCSSASSPVASRTVW